MKSLEELKKIRESALASMRVREQGTGTRIVVGMGTCGIAAGARETLTAIMDELGKRALSEVSVTQTGCVGLCEKEPIVEVYTPSRGKVVYGRVTPQVARDIVARHVVNDQIVSENIISHEKMTGSA